MLNPIELMIAHHSITKSTVLTSSEGELSIITTRTIQT